MDWFYELFIKEAKAAIDHKENSHPKAEGTAF